MAKSKKIAGFLAVYFLLFLCTVALRTVQVYDDTYGVASLTEIRSCFVPLLWVSFSAMILWCIFYCRHMLAKTDVYLWNRHAYPSGFFASLCAAMTMLLLVSSFIPSAIQSGQPYWIALMISSLCSAALFVLIAICHFKGGWGGRKGLQFLMALGPIVFFVIRLVYIFITLVAIYPTVQHILDQLKDTALVLFFLGYAKAIWFSGEDTGGRLAAYMSFIAPLFIGVAVFPQMIFPFVSSGAEITASTVIEQLFYLSLIAYMLSFGITISRRKNR